MAFIAGALGGLGGSALSGILNAREAKKQRKWQEDMSNTAFQRSRRDLEKAGLNPLLAMGAPASTPSGAKAEIPNLGDSISKGVQASTALMQAKASVRKTDAEATILEKEIPRVDIETDVWKGINSAWDTAKDWALDKINDKGNQAAATSALDQAKSRIRDAIGGKPAGTHNFEHVYEASTGSHPLAPGRATKAGRRSKGKRKSPVVPTKSLTTPGPRRSKKGNNR